LLSHSSCVGYESRSDRERLSTHEGEERAQTEQGQSFIFILQCFECFAGFHSTLPGFIFTEYFTIAPHYSIYETNTNTDMAGSGQGFSPS